MNLSRDAAKAQYSGATRVAAVPHDLAHSRFARRLRATPVDAAACRRIVLRYALRYQSVYSFDRLEDAFTWLELVDADPARLADARAHVLADVEDAMAEYFISLNEVAAAVHRLFDATPMSPDDVLSCVDHIWNAHECNESVAEFSGREDAALCELLDELSPR